MFLCRLLKVVRFEKKVRLLLAERLLAGCIASGTLASKILGGLLLAARLPAIYHPEGQYWVLEVEI